METQLDMPIFLGLPWQTQLAWTLRQTSEKYDEDNFFRAKYVHTENVDEPVRMERPESPHANNAFQRQEFYFHRDRLGNITEITDFEGTVVQSYIYDAFGSVTIYDKDGSEITPSNSNYLETPYAFTGRELDPETGLYFYRARYYDPNLGRFISEDPVKFEGGLNFYVYTENNPVNRIDPFGLGWIYHQSLGLIYRIDENGRIETETMGKGYSGALGYVNDPAFQNIRNKGVIPEGTYDIERPDPRPGFGDPVLPLTPRKGVALGRDNFLIHGDNNAMNQSASRGCIILNPKIRNRIVASGDNVLVVYR